MGRSSSRWGDDEAFTDEQLRVIDAIEASYVTPSASPSPYSSCSSSSGTPTVRKSNPRHGRENPTEMRRQLPRSITSPSSRFRRFPFSRCRAGFGRFPAMRFGGEILYSKTACEVDKNAKQLLKVLDSKRIENGGTVIGLDIEWKPSFKRGVLPGKVAVMQICGDNHYCHVLHIVHSGIPESLRCLLEDSTIVKVGVGIDGDSVKLFHDYGVSIMGVEDLSNLANTKLGGEMKKWGLASLTERLVSKELLKPNRIRLGNWEVNVLSKEQLQYAATDAFASWHLYQVLKGLPDDDDDKR
ncbi:PREDICTED: Werner Syndrome-like exonuclease [Tarenaya hassleriana]|uniref:Werner Syndrome-like exonuclease n=1 Tax=Tarenaya hassleriana TaxID=28532 RepID=UPI00053CA8A3|nr:PREDICTED: Werner Syndrome-like exonuclease [Tarenaya hassleriana]